MTSDQGHRLHSITSRGTATDKVSSAELSASTAPVVEVDISENSSSASTTVLQSDGTISIVQPDLSPIAVSKLVLKETPHINILGASILDLHTARKTVLKARPDVLGALSDASRIVVAVSGFLDEQARRRSVSYAAWAIEPIFGSLVSRLEVSQLFEYSLSQLVPLISNVDVDILTTAFGPRYAFVDLKTSKGLLRFDLQTVAPRPTIAPADVVSGMASYTPVSPAHVLAAFPGRLRILDVNYSTVQTSFDQKTKRKRNSQGLSTPTQLICYFSHISRALARDGLRLVAIDLTMASSLQNGAAITSTLADNINRGVNLRSRVATHLAVTEQNMGGSMRQQHLSAETRQTLTAMLERDEIDSFETLIQRHFFETNERLATAAADEVIDFVLSSLFGVQGPAEDQTFETRLRLNVVAPKVLLALCTRGLLSPSNLKRALRLGKDQSAGHLRYDDIAKALQNADSSLALLAGYVEKVTIPDVHAQTLLLKFLVQQVLILGNEAQQPRLLTAESSEEMTLEAFAADAHSQAPELLVLDRCLIAVMERYASFDVSTTSSSIRSTLSSDEIFGVVQLLRQQMFRGGHTGSALTVTDDLLALSRDRVSLKSAVNILSACLDATGPLELVGGEDEDKLIEKIIPDLLSEISLATQYIEESADLQGILRETLRYAEFQQPQVRSKTPSNSTGNKPGQVGEITTLYAQRTEDEDINGLPGALPLSLRADEAIKLTKVRRGGGQMKQRSEREMLILENRRKGPYTFERLVL